MHRVLGVIHRLLFLAHDIENLLPHLPYVESVGVLETHFFVKMRRKAILLIDKLLSPFVIEAANVRFMHGFNLVVGICEIDSAPSYFDRASFLDKLSRVSYSSYLLRAL